MVQNNLKKYINDFFAGLTLYDDYKNGHHYKDLLKASIDVFLEHENTYNAYEIYETFFMIYQITSEDKSEELKNVGNSVSEANTLLKLVRIMRDYEENTGDLIEKQRDHFIHSVNVFILGLAIFSQNVKYRDAMAKYIKKSKYKKYYRFDDGTLSREEFLYRWGIAALFHDIGYPVEIIGKQLTKFINDGIQSISDDYSVQTAIDFKNFNEFNSIVKIDPHFTNIYREDYSNANFMDMFKPTDIMAHKISEDLGVNPYELADHLDNFIYYMGDKGFVDHGYFSAILVLNSYGSLMQKHYAPLYVAVKEREEELLKLGNADEEELKRIEEEKDKIVEKYSYFFYPVVDSASAILLHNYYRNAMQNDFGQKQLEPSKSPIAYLLILCDELQEWNRRPIGIKDKKKSHVNEIDIEITNDKFEVDYIIKHGSIGLGFSEEKESFLRSLLNIKAIFRKFDVYTDVELDLESPMTKVIPSETEVPDVLLRNIERIARKIHENYNKIEEAKGKETTPFDELSPIYKKSNVRQAKSYPRKLNIIGCEMAAISDERPAHNFTDDEIEDLAILEHKDWCDEKRNTGYISHHEAFNPELVSEEDLISREEFLRFDEANKEEKDRNPDIEPIFKDDDRRIHPNLVDWDDLNEETKDKDRDPVRQMPDILEDLGLKIVKTKLRLLTLEMHKLFKDEYGSLKDVPSFEELDEATKYSNYKQTTFLIKILAENNYKIVSKEVNGKAVHEFTDDEVEYFAQREHNAWYRRKVNLGWNRGPRDVENKTNPNIAHWDELDFDTKEANMFTFIKLPESCDKVGLKIIRG